MRGPFRGFPIFFDLDKLRSKERGKYALKMVGQTWWPLVISQDRTAGEAPTGPWVFALTKEGLFDFWPREFWERIPTVIRFYGEVLHAPVETQFGHSDCLLKARAIAVLVKDQL